MNLMVIDNAAVIGFVLKVVRTSERLSQEVLANRSGIAGTRISKYEGIRQYPDLATVVRLLDAAGWELVARRRE